LNFPCPLIGSGISTTRNVRSHRERKGEGETPDAITQFMIQDPQRRRARGEEGGGKRGKGGKKGGSIPRWVCRNDSENHGASSEAVGGKGEGKGKKRVLYLVADRGVDVLHYRTRERKKRKEKRHLPIARAPPRKKKRNKASSCILAQEKGRRGERKGKKPRRRAPVRLGPRRRSAYHRVGEGGEKRDLE